VRFFLVAAEGGDVFPVAKKRFLDFLPVGFLLISCKSLQKKQRFENTSLTRENGHAVHAAGVADPFLLKEHSRYTEMTAILFGSWDLGFGISRQARSFLVPACLACVLCG